MHKYIEIEGKNIYDRDILEGYKLLQEFCGEKINVNIVFKNYQMYDSFSENINLSNILELYKNEVIESITMKPIGKSNIIVRIHFSTGDEGSSIYIDNVSKTNNDSLANKLENYIKSISNQSFMFYVRKIRLLNWITYFSLTSLFLLMIYFSLFFLARLLNSDLNLIPQTVMNLLLTFATIFSAMFSISIINSYKSVQIKRIQRTKYINREKIEFLLKNIMLPLVISIVAGVVVIIIFS